MEVVIMEVIEVCLRGKYGSDDIIKNKCFGGAVKVIIYVYEIH